MSDRCYIIRSGGRLPFGYYDAGRRAFSAQVDFLGLGTANAVLVTDTSGSRLLAVNPDITCEIPFCCRCVDDLIPILEANGFVPLFEKDG